MLAYWRARWGATATPLLWSHAMHVVLADELDRHTPAHPTGPDSEDEPPRLEKLARLGDGERHVACVCVADHQACRLVGTASGEYTPT